MNRSIFQIWLKDMGIIFNRFKVFFLLNLKNLIIKIKSKNFANLLFLFLVLLFIVIDSNFYSCSNIKFIIDKEPILRELVYKNIRFKAHNTINDQVAKISFEAFRHHFFSTANLNFNVSKYFENDKGVLKCFDRRSPFSHPNINFGLFGDGLVNYQFSHQKMLDFSFINNNDLYNTQRSQYISDLINIYNKNLNWLNLNFNDLQHNNQFLDLNYEIVLNETKDSVKVQTFCDKNKIDILNKTRNYLTE